MTKLKYKLIPVVVVGGLLLLLLMAQKVIAPNVNIGHKNNISETFNKKQYSLEKPDSLWIIVNKKRPLPSTFAPSKLTAANFKGQPAESSEIPIKNEVYEPLAKLIADAIKDGNKLFLISGYRSYSVQKQVYDASVTQDGKEKADKTSARPGHSEHQTGLAADLGTIDHKCELQTCFGETDEGKWLANNAHKYGFVLRYPKGKDHITGFSYEPWHIRYVGIDLAEAVYKSNLTLEQFFSLPNAPNY